MARVGGTQLLLPVRTHHRASQHVSPPPPQFSMTTDLPFSNFWFDSPVCCVYLLSRSQRTNTVMEAAICTLVTQFKTYAGEHGCSSTLSKEEFRNLVTSQLPNYVKVHPQRLDKAIWRIMHALGRCGFAENLIVVYHHSDCLSRARVTLIKPQTCKYD